MPKTWVRERLKDHYYRKSKEEGFRSRAAYKLLQIAAKFSFFKRGDVVVDLGSAPGGWIQATRKIVGDEGFIVGVDLEPVDRFSDHNVRTLIGDITEEATVQQVESILPRKADALVCDASPNISGIWDYDHARQMELARHAMKIALRVLKPSGSFLTKAFEGDMFAIFVQDMRSHFKTVRIVKPKASRPGSSEIYVLGMCLNRTADDQSRGKG